jgi:Zn-dependent alcohol dehydrogenase
MKNILAAVLFSQKKKMKVINIKPKNKLQYGQVLVKIKYAGICGSQIGEIHGVKGKDYYLPHLMGHEGYAIVEGIGPGVKKVKKNDKVVMHWKTGSGINAESASYCSGKTNINGGQITTFSNFSIVSENRLTKVNSSTDPRLATLLGCTVTTAFGAAGNDAQLKIGDNVIIWGAGNIGLALIIAAKMNSANKIIVIDLNEKKLKIAKKLGADIFLNAKKKNFKERIIKECKSHHIDVIFETTGSAEVITNAYNLLCKKGKLILIGVPNINSKVSINTLPLHFGRVIKGSHGGNINPDIDIPKYENIINKNKKLFSRLIFRSINLKDINKGIDSMVKNQNPGKILIKF